MLRIYLIFHTATFVPIDCIKFMRLGQGQSGVEYGNEADAKERPTPGRFGPKPGFLIRPAAPNPRRIGSKKRTCAAFEITPLQ